jgi:hypothetical protein
VRATTILLLLLALGAAGCVTVSPWEREVLARPDMGFEGNRTVSSAEGHHAGTREGSAGGFGSGGGGCGCN